MEPPPVLVQSQKPSLKTKTLNQVQKAPLKTKIANQLKALTSNIQLILDSLQGSDMVEVKGYEIRNGRVWRKYVMPHNWRTTFYPSQEYVMANNHQHMQLEQKPEVGSSSSNQNDDNNNNNLVV
ncbi:unnamed protein product [Brassica rapa]|uniref:Uncharacterized protein n=1 Tax=Brassica campestris TaxID=3711 RepID=A0A8D9CQF3_BRACM|nr:unnamed protein product [Brassica rapa]